MNLHRVAARHRLCVQLAETERRECRSRIGREAAGTADPKWILGLSVADNRQGQSDRQEHGARPEPNFHFEAVTPEADGFAKAESHC